MKLAEQQQNHKQAEAGKLDTQLALIEVVSGTHAAGLARQ